VAGLLFVAVVVLASLGLPLAVLGFWISRGSIVATLPDIVSALGQSLSAAVPAAILAGIMALPVAVLVVRYPSALSRLVERLAMVGYAVPALAFALSLLFFALRAVPWAYQTLGLLILAYALSFLALALGPIRRPGTPLVPRWKRCRAPWAGVRYAPSHRSRCRQSDRA
jgi:iron(III) transport system permease protein